MAEGTDAARDRVLAARAELAGEIETLEASARAAVDIPAKVRREPAKAAAIAGGAGFLALGGPKRVLRGVRRAVFGPEPPAPKRMLPKEIEKTLDRLGEDGERIRGTIERDFADYVDEARKRRGPPLAAAVTGAVARPVLMRVAKEAAAWFTRTDQEGFQAQLERVRTRSSTGEPKATGDTIGKPKGG